jgi:uncharacterized membrane protein YeaQ/YmgE (transglycosylase-associated protein family)
MGIIATIIIGFFVGLIARFVKPGDDKMGFIMTTLLGIAGAMFGSYMGQLFGIYQVGEPVGFFGAVIGAVLLLLIVGLISGRKNR